MDHYNQKWVLRFAMGKPKWAITLGQQTFYSCAADEVSFFWKLHEDYHKKQWRREGYIWFPLQYIWEYLSLRLDGCSHKEAYHANRFEREAVTESLS
jgi:hypothetical protein